VPSPSRRLASRPRRRGAPARGARSVYDSVYSSGTRALKARGGRLRTRAVATRVVGLPVAVAFGAAACARQGRRQGRALVARGRLAWGLRLLALTQRPLSCARSPGCARSQALAAARPRAPCGGAPRVLVLGLSRARTRGLRRAAGRARGAATHVHSCFIIPRPERRARLGTPAPITARAPTPSTAVPAPPPRRSLRSAGPCPAPRAPGGATRPRAAQKMAPPRAERRWSHFHAGPAAPRGPPAAPQRRPAPRPPRALAPWRLGGASARPPRPGLPVRAPRARPPPLAPGDAPRRQRRLRLRARARRACARPRRAIP
jgi:hypothetical protein